MSGETTERPFSRTILGAIATVCFGLFGAGLTLWMQTITVGADRAYVFLAIMTTVFVVSMVVAAQGGRHTAGSYSWKHWAALVVPILLLVRLTAFFGQAPDDRDGVLGIVGGLLDLTALMLVIILALTWMAGMRVLRNIELLHPQRSEIPPSKRSPQYYEWLNDRGRFVDRSAAIGELTSLAATAGGLLVGLTAFNVAVGTETRQAGVVQTSLIIMVLYYVSVLLLLSYANLVRRTSQWSLELAAQAPGLTGTWIRSAIVLLVVALVVALLIPAADTDVFAQFGLVILDGMLWVARIVLAIGLLGFSLIARLLELLRPEGGGPVEPPPPEDLLQPSGEGIDFGLFLAALVVLIVGSLSLYWLFRAVQRNYQRVSAQRTSRSLLSHILLVLRALLASILGLFGWTRTVAQAVGASVRALAGRRRAMQANLASIRRRGGGTLRQQLHEIYAETVDEASARGVHRGASATPSEYRARLAARCTTATAAVDGLTEMYVAARYAPELGPDHGVERARRLQAEVGRALQAPPDD